MSGDDMMLTEVNCETGEITERPLTAAEVKQRTADGAAAQQAEAEAVPPLTTAEIVALRALLSSG